MMRRNGINDQRNLYFPSDKKNLRNRYTVCYFCCADDKIRSMRNSNFIKTRADMSEAHQAVSYSKLIKEDHTEANHDKEVLRLVFKSGTMAWEKGLTQLYGKLRNAVYPAHVESFWFISMLVMALHFSSKKLPFDAVHLVGSQLPG